MNKPHTYLAQRIVNTFNFDKRLFFILLTLLFISIRFVTNDIILESIPGYEQLSKDGSLTFFHIFNSLNYLWTPFSILWKVTVISFFLWTATFTLGYKINYTELWKYVLVAEAVFILPELIKMLMYINPSSNFDFDTIKNTYPLSTSSLFDLSSISTRYIYPLKSVNLFELIYAYVLTLCVHTLSKRNLKVSALIVLFGYIIPLIVWLTFYVLVYR